MKKIKTLILLVIIVITTVPTKSLTSQSLHDPSYPDRDIFYDSICSKIIAKKDIITDIVKHKKIKLSHCYFNEKDPKNFKIVFKWKDKGKNSLTITGPNYNYLSYKPRTAGSINFPGIGLETNKKFIRRDGDTYHYGIKNMNWSIHDIRLILKTINVLYKGGIISFEETNTTWAAICKDEEYFKIKKIIEGS